MYLLCEGSSQRSPNFLMAWANSYYCGKINRWSPRWKDQSLQKICKAKTCSFAARRSLDTLYMISSGVWIPQSFLKMPSSNILIIVELAVAELKDVEWDPTPFERLELKQEKKMIIQALAESVQPGQDVMFDDFVAGKGQGVYDCEENYLLVSDLTAFPMGMHV